MYICPPCFFSLSVIPKKFVRINSQWGLDNNEGRLEVWAHGEWGTVCRNGGFDKNVVAVACKELGYKSGIRVEPPKDIDEPETRKPAGPVWMDDLKCTGKERSIFECEHEISSNAVDNENCHHNRDIYLNCSE